MNVPDTFSSPYGRARQPTEHIRYSREAGFSGITPQDKEQWLRKYPHIDDFDTTVAEGAAWLSKYWDKACRAEEKPREFLDWWLAAEWIPVSGYKEPDTVYNPEQLSAFIEEYFKAGELRERLTRGKHDGLSDSLASRHYDKALGHAVNLRGVVPDFPKTPDSTGRPHADLRRLQEWCIECETIVRGLYAKVRPEDIENVLSLLRELDDHLKSGFPTPDTAALSKIQKQVWGEIERLAKVIGELGEPSKAFTLMPAGNLESKIRHWLNCVIWDRGCDALLEKMQECGVPVPEDKQALTELLYAAEWMGKTDWNKVHEIVEEKKSGQSASTRAEKRGEQGRILGSAKMAEEKINALAYKRYCREHPDYDKALQEAQARMVSLYNGVDDAVNSQQDLAKIVYLRSGKLESVFKRPDDALFGTSFHKSTPDQPLRDAVEELEAIRESILVMVLLNATSRGTEVSTMEQLNTFIVHGHDKTAMLELKDYLQNTLGLPEPVILEQQASRGRTVIESFEEHSANTHVAFVLLTPDDVGGSGNDVLKNRARQNVIFELGVFVGKFGRLSGRVILLYKPDLDIPSDLAGVIYIDISNGIRTAGETIRKELNALLRKEPDLS